METLGYIGLGNMGGPMAANLIAAGNDVICYDAAGSAAHIAADVKMATLVADLVTKARIVFLCLPDGKIVASVAQEIIAASNRITEIVIDNTTEAFVVEDDVVLLRPAFVTVKDRKSVV